MKRIEIAKELIRMRRKMNELGAEMKKNDYKKQGFIYEAGVDLINVASICKETYEKILSDLKG
jgi:hypothetical protein